jgi:nucleoside-diphosphate-sugar epimerase/predicted dehydrogenase
LNDSGTRLAIIGGGFLARTRLLPALHRIGWLPEVLVDPVSQRAEALSREVGTPGSVATAPDWTSVADRFDAAIVAVPNAWHGPVGTALAAAGKHLLMEPPFATRGAPCRAVMDAAGRSGVVLRAARPRRHLHAARWTEAVIRSGQLGPLRRVEWREGRVFDRSGVADAVLWPEEGGVLANPGVHALDLAAWWFGGVTPVRYRDDGAGGVESECILDCRLEEAEGRIELSRSRDLPNTCLLEGAKGFLEVHLHRNQVIRCSDNVRTVLYRGLAADALAPQDPVDLYEAVLKDFRAAVGGGGGRKRPDDDGCQMADLIERCYAMRTPLPAPWAAAARSEAPAVAPGTRVVVTGATGFIGGRLVERLVEQGAKVCCLIRNPASAVRLARLPVEFRHAELTDAAAVDDALRETGLVFHCAYDWGSAAANRSALAHLIDGCIAHSVGRLVHVSTFSVYAPYPDGVLHEDTPDGDRSQEYTRTKLELEKDLLDAVRGRGLRGTILQPTIVYGPFSKPWTINPAEQLMLDTLVLPDRGEGLCNAVFVDDVVDAMLLAATRPDAVGERFIVSGPEAVTWSEFYEAFARAVGAKGPEYWPRDVIEKRKSGLRNKIRVAVSDPKKVVRIARRMPGLRQALDLSWRTLPGGLCAAVENRYNPKSRPVGQLHVPDLKQLRFLAGKPVVDSGKARRLIGYDPRFDFKSGMVPTARYLEWAYGLAAQGGEASPSHEPT